MRRLQKQVPARSDGAARRYPANQVSYGRAFSPLLFHNEMSLLLIFLMGTNMIGGVLILPAGQTRLDLHQYRGRVRRWRLSPTGLPPGRDRRGHRMYAALDAERWLEARHD
jgi:hypothetical protein